MSSSNSEGLQAGANETVPLLEIRRTVRQRGAVEPKKDDGSQPNGARSASSSYGLGVAVCFVLNYSIGSGVLGLPNEFVKVGYILGSVLLIWVAILSYCTYRYVSNCCIRAEALESLINQHANNGLDARVTREYLRSGSDPIFVGTELHRMRISSLDLQRFYRLERNSFQLNELIGIFCGKRVRYIYEVCFFCAQVSGLWGFMALFGASLTKVAGIDGVSGTCNIEDVWAVSSDYDDSDAACLRLYSIYVSIFWVWAVFVSMVEFEHQQGLQIVSTIARVSIILLMACVSIGLLYSNVIYDGTSFVETSASVPHAASGVTSFNVAGLLYFIGVASFAFTNQFCVRDVVEPLKDQDRNKQVKLWGTSMSILFTLYLIAGITVSLAFGENVESPCTLAFGKFLGFDYTSLEDRPLYASIIGWSIVLLPAIDIASSYPLNAITTANSMAQTFLNMSESSDFYWHLVIRFVLCTVTAILALLVWNFDFIVVLSGGLAMIALVAIPSYMEYRSRLLMTSIVVGNDEMAPNTRSDNNFQSEWIDSKFFYIAAAVTSIIAFVGVVADVVRET